MSTNGKNRSDLIQLAEELLKESAWANADHSNNTLLELGDTFENLPPEEGAENNRALELYCRLLMLTEGAGLDPGATRLNDLLNPKPITLAAVPNPSESQPSQAEPDSPLGIRHPLAQGFLGLAEYWLTETPPPSSPAIPDRVIAYVMVLALEAEFTPRISPLIETFWSKREASIRSLMDPSKVHFELHQRLKARLQEDLFKGAGDQSPFPEASCLTSFKYVLALKDASHFEPTLLEIGIFLYFFGQDLELEGVRLQNHLGLAGLSPQELPALFSRLSRVHRVKTKLFSALREFARPQLDILQEDVFQILKSVSGLAPENRGRNAA